MPINAAFAGHKKHSVRISIDDCQIIPIAEFGTISPLSSVRGEIIEDLTRITYALETHQPNDYAQAIVSYLIVFPFNVRPVNGPHLGMTPVPMADGGTVDHGDEVVVLILHMSGRTPEQINVLVIPSSLSASFLQHHGYRNN